MRGQRLGLVLLLPLGVGLGVLIAGIPDVSPEMESSSALADSQPTIVPTSTAPTTTPTSEPTTTTTAVTPSVHSPRSVDVVVLNGARIEGAAADVSERLAELGYATLQPANAPATDTTTVYHRDGYEGDARAVVAELGPGTIDTEPLPDPSPFDGVDDAQLVVVLGTDHEPATQSDGTSSTTSAPSNE